MAHLSIRLLGCPEITLDKTPVTHFESDKVRALLAYLAAESGTPHRREKLAGLLWPDSPDRAARTNLRHVLAELRQAIGDREAHPPFLHVTRQALQFNGAGETWVDVRAFSKLLESQDPGGPSTAQLEDAVALYRGGFLEGFSLPGSAPFEEWALLTREQLRRLALESIEQLVDRYEAAEAYEAALSHAWRMVELDPWRERAHRQLMRLLTLTGQRTAALAQYEACRQLLEEELGAQPGAQTTALNEKILAGELAVRGKTASPPPHNLPVQPTPFVGREPELAAIDERLKDPACRLLTLVGPGGSGKTRLALEAARRQLERFPDGVFFVSLAPLNSAMSIVPAVADALGFTFYESGEPRQQLLDYLRAKTMLLILDNFEHLLAPLPGETTSGAGLATETLRTAPEVKILATSRVRLNVGGEHRFQVVGMQFPISESSEMDSDEASTYSAVKLFVQGARRAKQAIELSEENIRGVVQICRLVEGMPLAVRLAAPWVAVLSPHEIASQLAHDLDLLATDRQDVPARQRSVRASLDHTWRLISERERELMQALSIFRGAFAREAAQQVTGASLRDLMALADRSLVFQALADRYQVHELLRQFVHEKLTASPAAAAAACDRHSVYYIAALERWDRDFRGVQQTRALAEMRAEIENARAALEWALRHRQTDRLDTAVGGLCQFYRWTGRFAEGITMCRAVAQTLGKTARGDEIRVLVRVLLWEGSLCIESGRFDRAGVLVRQCIDLLDSSKLDACAEKGWALEERGWIAFHSGDNHGARQFFEQSLVVFRALGDSPYAEAYALAALGYVAWSLGAFDEARHLAEHSLALRRSIGDQRGMAASLSLLGSIAAYSGYMDESVQLRKKAVAIQNELEDRPGAAAGRFALATGLIWCGRFAEAQSLLQESLKTFDDLGFSGGIADAGAFLGWIDMMRGSYETAQIRIENSRQLYAEGGLRRGIGIARLFLGMLTLADNDLAAAKQMLKEAADVYGEIGQRDEWLVATGSLGYAQLLLDDISTAQRHLCQALKAGAEIHGHGLLLMAIPATALLLAQTGEKEKAVEIYALASRHAFIADSRYYEDIIGRHIAAVAATLPQETVTAAQERGRARDLWETAEELAKELEKQLGTAESG